MRKLLLSAIALGAFFTACKDDEATPAPTLPTVTKQLKFILDGTDSTAMQYDAAGKLTHFERYDLENKTVVYIKPVSANGKVTGLLAGQTLADMTHKAVDCIYDNAGRLLKINTYSVASGTVRESDSLAYDANGRVIGLYETSISTNGDVVTVNPTRKWTYTWDANGNIVSEVSVRIEDGKETTDKATMTYTYDEKDKANYMTGQFELYLVNPENAVLVLSRNNVVSKVTSVPGKYTITDDVKYQYDADKYPVGKMYTTFDPDGLGGNAPGTIPSVIFTRIGYVK